VLERAPGVQVAQPTPSGAAVRVTGRAAVPSVVAALTAAGVAVFGIVPRPPTLEDVYFALTAAAAGGAEGATGGPVEGDDQAGGRSHDAGAEVER
jgi:hypothetical protein